MSANRRTYGPGGSYNIFAGVDASRGFVTGCFKDDRTADLRGVEQMFIPLDDPAVDNKYTTAELAAIKAEERTEAERKVFLLAERRREGDLLPVSALMEKTLDLLDKMKANTSGVTGLSTGYVDLDMQLTGLHGGELRLADAELGGLAAEVRLPARA